MIRVENWKEILPKFEPSIRLTSSLEYEGKLLESGSSVMVLVGSVFGILQRVDDGILVRHVVGKGLRKVLDEVYTTFGSIPLYCHCKGSRCRLYEKLGFKEVKNGYYKYSK